MALLQTHGVKTASQQAALFYARERRKDRQGFSQQPQTHRFIGSGAMALTPIATGTVFPNRLTPITFQTRIQITANGGVHRGLIFEFGSSTRGAAAWVGDQTIGLTAGGLTTEQAVATWDLGAELPPGREFQLTFVMVPGTGEVAVLAAGRILARATASAGNFNGDWADSADGSFATALVGTVASGVPALSQIAPNGFTVIEALHGFVGTVPRFLN